MLRDAAASCGDCTLNGSKTDYATPRGTALLLCATRTCGEFDFRAMGLRLRVCRSWRDSFQPLLSALPGKLQAELARLTEVLNDTTLGSGTTYGQAVAKCSSTLAGLDQSDFAEVFALSSPPDGVEQVLHVTYGMSQHAWLIAYGGR